MFISPDVGPEIEWERYFSVIFCSYGFWNQYLNHLLHNSIKKSQNIMEYKIVDNKKISLKIFEHWRKNGPNCVYCVKCKIGSLLVQLARNLSVPHKV